MFSRDHAHTNQLVAVGQAGQLTVFVYKNKILTHFVIVRVRQYYQRGALQGAKNINLKRRTCLVHGVGPERDDVLR